MDFGKIAAEQVRGIRIVTGRRLGRIAPDIGLKTWAAVIPHIEAALLWAFRAPIHERRHSLQSRRLNR
jgi:hypothetical protein